METLFMWKLALGFVIFAAVALFAIYKAGGNVDMSGEKHGADAVHAPEDTKPAAAPSAAPDTPAAAPSAAPDTPAAAPAPAK